MFRTRDFVLIFTIVMFLLMAIGTTWWSKQYDSSSSDELVITSAAEGEYQAEVYIPTTISRADRLAEMKEKIAADQTLVIANDIPEINDEVEPDDFIIPELTEVKEELRCSGYLSYSGRWSPTGLQMEVVEGSRLVFREETQIQTVGTSTEEVVVKVPILQLPIQFANADDPYCISSDVVGVALDGSLIRNNELSLYSVFGYETLIGYALDGFPIYGVGASSVDQCGGVSVGGQYSYWLNTESATIINCFVAPPISL
tara:strand:+ start:1990 stop:2760 length:771 start_codon:yes stop_codon:yes gene_type:complete